MRKNPFLIKIIKYLILLSFPLSGFLIFNESIYRGLDGSYYIWMRDLIPEGNYNPFGLSLSHYQGTSSMQFPVNFLTTATFCLSTVFPFSGKVSVYISSSLIVLIVSNLLSCILKFSNTQQTLFSLLCFAALLPLPLGFYGIADCSPVMPEIAMLVTLILVILQKKACINNKNFFLFIISVYILYTNPSCLIYLIPFIGLVIVRLASKVVSRIELKNLKTYLLYFPFIAVHVLVSLWALGHIVTTPAFVFKNEIQDSISIGDVSFIFWPGRKWPAAALICLSYIVAILNITRKKRDTVTSLSLVMLGFLAIQICLFVLISFKMINTRFVSCTYMEYLLVPINMILLTDAIEKRKTYNYHP